jgi:subtilase family serine protease
MQHSRSTLLSLSLPRLSTLSLCILIFSTLSFAAAPDRISSAINASGTIALAKSHHPMAQPQYDQGPTDPTRQLTYISLVMSPSPSQQKALNLLLAQQQNPRSASYHKWLTPQQYADRFGLSQNDLTKITTWLKSQDFQILSIGGGRNSVVFSGTVAQAQRAFATEIHNYEINGIKHFANSTPLMIPAALDGIVTGVIGLHSFLPQPTSVRRGASRAAHSRPNYYDANFIFPNFLAPDDIATIYDIAPLYNASTPIDGSGQTLGIIGQTDVYLADLNDFRSGFGLSTISCTGTNSSGIITACDDTHFQYVFVTGNGTDPGAPSTCGDLGEADLDLEWSGATARNAKIIYFNSPVTFNSDCTEVVSGGGVNAALIAALNPPTGPVLTHVVSMSYGYCESGAEDLETYLQQGNAEGVTIMNSAGDVGSAACDYSPPSENPPFSGAQDGLAVSYPASSPEVTGVGGTAISLANDSYPNLSSYWSTTLGTNGGTAVSYIPEIPWNDDEELASYCHEPAQGDTFCSSGGGTPDWVALSTTATAKQVQSDIWINMGGGGASNCWYETQGGVCLGAGPGPSGGGFATPTYQQTLSVAGAPAGVRYVPDVSLLASPDFPGYIWCTAQSELFNGGTSASSCANGIAGALNNANYTSVVGGTSASSPVFAGIVTLLNQYVVLNGGAAGLGNINTNLYSLAAASPSAFHQVKTGDNMVYCQPGTPADEPVGIMCPTAGVFGYEASNADAATGYNLVTGLGSVDAYNLVHAWPSSTTPGFTLGDSPASLTITQGETGETSTITVTDQGGFTGGVTLVATGLPTGVTALFSPNPATTTSTLTLTASAAATAGTATVTITGTSAALTATTTLALTVDQNFTVPATLTPPAGSSPGQTTTTTMLISPTPPATTFSTNVTYTCSAGLPAGATCSFSPAQITAGSPATTVTITVQTAGPFTGAVGGARHKLLGQEERLWLPLSLPLAGVLLVGVAGRGLSRRYKIVGLCLALALAGLLVACGGGSSSPPASVSVSPSTVNTLYPNLAGAPAQTQQFTATVANSTNQSVTWAVAGVTGGNATVGTISATGLYTAPVALPSPTSETITATSTATTTPGTATVNLLTPTPAGTYPITVTITEGAVVHTTTFSLVLN